MSDQTYLGFDVLRGSQLSVYRVKRWWTKVEFKDMPRHWVND